MTTVDVVVFTGGRGSAVLSERLMAHPRIRLTLAVNGYDDGASTGEIRRFLGDALGPSDFRKNASRVARAKRACAPELIDLLDARLPTRDDAGALVDELADGRVPVELAGSAAGVPAEALRLLAVRVRRFLAESAVAGREFAFA